MFNLFFRRYVPGFRVGSDGVPGFDIDDNGLPRRATASFGGTLPDSTPQQYPNAAQTQTPPRSASDCQVPRVGSHRPPLPGFRVSPQGDVPGFNVGPRYGAPGFNVDENGRQQQETIWSDDLPPGSVPPQDPNTAQTPTPPSYVDDSAAPASPSLPDWPYQRGPVPPPRLPTVFDPRTGPRLEIIPPPRIGPVTVPGATPWPPSITPQPLPDGDIRARAATTQNINSQPAGRQAMRTARLPPPEGGWSHGHGEDAVSPIPLVGLLQIPTSALRTLAMAASRKAQQETLVQPYQQTQPRMPSALLGTGLPTSGQLETQNLKMAGFEPRSDQEYSQLIEAYRQLKEAEDKQLRDRPPMRHLQVKMRFRPTHGQRWLVPGAEARAEQYGYASSGFHYQGLASQQLGAGNYVGAGVYQVAAILDAVAGALTLGLGTELTRRPGPLPPKELPYFDARSTRSGSSKIISGRLRMVWNGITSWSNPTRLSWASDPYKALRTLWRFRLRRIDN